MTLALGMRLDPGVGGVRCVTGIGVAHVLNSGYLWVGVLAGAIVMPVLTTVLAWAVRRHDRSR